MLSIGNPRIFNVQAIGLFHKIELHQGFGATGWNPVGKTVFLPKTEMLGLELSTTIFFLQNSNRIDKYGCSGSDVPNR